MSALLKKSWKDLSRRRARTVFTVLTVALGVMGVGLFAITPLADRAVQGDLRAEKMHNVGVRLNGIYLTPGQLGHLEAIENVEKVSQRIVLPVTTQIGGKRATVLLIGIPDYDNQAVDVIRVVSGKTPEGMQVLTDQGNRTNSVISLSEGDRLAVQGPKGRWFDLRVTGVGKNFIHSGATRGGTAVFYTSMEALERISGKAGFTYLGFRVKNTETHAMDATVEDIRDYMVSRTTVVAFDDLADVREEGYWEGREMFASLMSFIGILAYLILFVSLFLISNTMNTMVSEQTREIAMMKAIGATRGTVFRSFLTTSVIIGLLGASIGAGLGILVANLVGSTFAMQGFGYQPPFAVHWPTVVMSLAIGVGVVVAASLPALVRTLRISVVQGLESHGISADYGRGFLDRSLMGIRGLPRVVQMGIRNAFRRKGRSVSTALQVAFAVGVVIAMLNMGDGLIDMTIGAYDSRTFDLWVQVDDNPVNPLTVGKASVLERIDGVRSAEPILNTVAEIGDRKVPLYGYAQATQSLDFRETLLERGRGRWWTPEEAKDAKRVVVIGEALSKYEDIALGDTIELMTATGSHYFEVIGIDAAFMENGQFIYAPLESVQKILQKGVTTNGFFIHTDSADHTEIDAVTRRVRSTMEDLGQRADVRVWYAMEERNVIQNEAIASVFLAVSFIVVLIVLIGLVSTLVMNILDRTTEIGMLRCIGAQSKDVRRVFSSEGLFLAFLGWVVGLPMGYLVYLIVVASTEAAMKLTLPPKYSSTYVFLSLVFALVGTLIVVFFPIRRASRMTPGDAIRYE